MRSNFFRSNHEIRAYNEAAQAVMQKLGVETNDLYSVAEALGDGGHTDAVHFTDDACKVMADAVIRSLGLQETESGYSSTEK